jgi:hypothetical protein
MQIVISKNAGRNLYRCTKQRSAVDGLDRGDVARSFVLPL